MFNAAIVAELRAQLQLKKKGKSVWLALTQCTARIPDPIQKLFWARVDFPISPFMDASRKTITDFGQSLPWRYVQVISDFFNCKRHDKRRT